MSTECSTNNSTSPQPAAAPPVQPTISSGSSAQRGAKPAPRRSRSAGIDSQTFWFWVMASPAIAGFVIFNFGPMLASGYLSLTQYDVVSPARFIGFDNYLYLMREDPAFWPSVKVTLVYASVSVPVGLLLSLSIALLLNRRVRMLGTFRTIYFLPSLLPATASAVVWIYIFHPNQGLLNRLLAQVGVAGPAWTQSVDWALPALIIMGLWGFGGAMVIFLAGLQDVPRSLYEAAELDGANIFQRFRNVTFPIISPVVFFNLVMGLIGAFKAFDSAYAFGMTSSGVPGGPARATLFYVLNLYLKAFNYFHMGLAAAMAWLLFAAIVLLTWVNFRLAKRWVHTG
jgi:multiple sugar transport system permease protein